MSSSDSNAGGMIKNDKLFTLEWLLAELILQTLLYNFFVVKVVRAKAIEVFSTFKCFDDVKLRSGTLMKNMADEVPVVFTVGMHHTVGGMLMLIGSYVGNENLWVHGALVECGFELCDMIYLIFNLDAWGSGAAKPELKGSVVFHHLPGLALVIPLTLAGFHASPHLQTIGAWLLLAGGVGLIGGAYIQTINFSTHMHVAAFAQAAVTLFLYFARMWVFPQASLLFLSEIEASGASRQLIIACQIGIGVLGIFNVVLCLLFTEKAYRYVRKALPGGVAIKLDEGEVVPTPYLYGEKKNQ